MVTHLLRIIPLGLGMSLVLAPAGASHRPHESHLLVQETTCLVRHVRLPKADASLSQLIAERFGADPREREIARKALAKRAPTQDMRSLAWTVYKRSPLHASLKAEFDQKIVSTADRTSPYLWRTVGEKPVAGWGLVIAMHGGGSGPKEMNDREWDYMFRQYYRDHPEAGGYVYLALRAPNDAWNGFYDDSICPLVERLIKQFVLYADVNPDKVITLGASHGGYGAFVIGPKIPYRFSAIHASASAPTEGETMGENLRDTRFTFMVGENDTAYGRADRCKTFEQQVEGWRTQYGGYPGEFELRKGTGHFVPDHDKVGEMLQSGPRNAWPEEIVWTQTDTVLKRFYWIEALSPVKGGHLEASVVHNTITVKAEKQDRLALWLDGALLDLGKPIIIRAGDRTQTLTVKPNLEVYCEGLEQTADPHLAAPVRIVVEMAPH